jgi:hypothetical protein
LRDGFDSTVYLVDRALLTLPVVSLRNEGRFGIIDLGLLSICDFGFLSLLYTICPYDMCNADILTTGYDMSTSAMIISAMSSAYIPRTQVRRIMYVCRPISSTAFPTAVIRRRGCFPS